MPNPLGIKQEHLEGAALTASPRLPSEPPSPYFGSFGVSHVHPGNGGGGSSSISRAVLVSQAPETGAIRHAQSLKRLRDEEEVSDPVTKRRRRATSTATQTELNEEEALLLRLKDDENLPWKDIALRFQTDLGKVYQVPALQMRMKRLRERMRVWTPKDVSCRIRTRETSSR